MQHLDTTLRFSPTDLNRFLECEHLIRLELTGDARPEQEFDPHAELLRRKGLDHEHAWLQRMRGEGRRVVEIDGGRPERDWERDALSTMTAMHDGADVIYQGVFVHDGWHGVGDFLVRVDTPSRLGGWSYEAWDTKLARRTRPYHVLQLCFYTRELGRIQGADPARMHVVLGTSAVDVLQYDDFSAYYDVVRRRFLDAVSIARPTYPYPVAHCGFCEYARVCAARWEADDHLSLVAHMRRAQVDRLNEHGVQTGAQLATLDPHVSVGIGRPTLERLRHQASLQHHHRTTGAHRYELLPVDEQTGFRLLPVPSPGDIFFDMEGDPHFEAAAGLEYLFGFVTTAPGPRGSADSGGAEAPEFRHVLALTREEEKAAFERFIDIVRERLRTWPDLHVYHYAPYEVAALERLMSTYGTREEELDDLLRREVFVDLYQVVRQSLRISHRSYSIKKVRTFFMEGAGQGAVADGGDSILEFERWRDTGDPAILDAIVRYNEEDCVSTLKLRDWLLERKREAEFTSGIDIPWRPTRAPEEKKPDRASEDARTEARRAALGARGGEADVLLANLLNYHRREAKPEWWAYFDRRKKSIDELMDDTQAIARLERVPGFEPEPVKRSHVLTLGFPAQEFKLGAGSKVEDPFHEGAAGEIAWIDAQAGRLGLKRGPALADLPAPAAVVAAKPIDTKAQRAALGRVADAVLSWTPFRHGDESPAGAPAHAPDRPYAAVADLLARAAPRMIGVPPGAPVQTLDLEAQTRCVSALDGSCLLVQGPPGSGKTWTGARLIVALMASGKRVGVAATSHKAINNLLEEVERVAEAAGVVFDGLKKGSGDDELRGRFIRDTESNDECETADVGLIAGTAWLFSRTGMDRRLDYLFIDEAGQVSLADAVAAGTAARNLVLLGDPQQLPQVRQGVHPEGAGVSVLEHLLGDVATVADDRGLFLATSWRMHPDLCRFVSELSYDGRLESASGCDRQRVDSVGVSGTGLRYLPIAHAGNAQQSLEEADAVAREVSRLLDGGRFTGCDGATRPLTPADILVVAPFNMQVRCLTERLPEGVPVGTVDKFQGREAPVVFFSMASSTGDDVPRGLEFLFSRNRFNVAVSRARALAVVVGSPRLLEVKCRSVEQMRLVNAVCRFVERSLHPQCTTSSGGDATGPHGDPAPRGARRASTRQAMRGDINDVGGASRLST